MNRQDLIYKIGLSLIPKLGNITTKNVVSYIGSIEGVFKEKKRNLQKIPGIGNILANNIYNAHNVLGSAEQELEFLTKNNIDALFYLDKDYPDTLKKCEDSPIIFYSKGNIDFNTNKIISIVGTRKPSEYGKDACKNIIHDLKSKNHDITIVSGLAYGIDITAHKSALENNLNTIAVLGSGFRNLYPPIHRETAKKITAQGALITEFTSSTMPDRFNFVQRNRIIAGISNATIVIESDEKGGALITAELANSYNRDVFAIPNRIGNKYLRGCNNLIKKNQAILLEDASDIEYFLGWEKKKNNANTQKQIIYPLTDNEKKVLDFLKKYDNINIDFICNKVNLHISEISVALFNLEFYNLVKMLPGNMYSYIK